MKRKDPRRWLRFAYQDGSSKTIEVGKCTTLRGDVKKVVFHLDELDDGKHLLIVSERVLGDGQKLKAIEVLREEDGVPEGTG